MRNRLQEFAVRSHEGLGPTGHVVERLCQWPGRADPMFVDPGTQVACGDRLGRIFHLP